MSYELDGNVEGLATTALMGVISNSMEMLNMTTNIRKSGDVAATRAMPGVSIDVMAEKTVPGTTEYMLRIEFLCETLAATDTDGDQVDNLVGTIRDILNGDEFLTALNEQARDIVFHDVREGQTFNSDEAKTKIRRRVIQADAWCYPGRVTT